MSGQAELILRIWVPEGQELPDFGGLVEFFKSPVEHVVDLLRAGCVAGQIVDERFEGWWEIKKGGL